MEREIPKVIHYCWFGGKPLPELTVKCIESWKKFLPDYEIKQWNEQNFDVHGITYTDEAYRLKKYAHVSDYARMWILYNYGGVYFDTDVEVIRPIDDILAKGSFMGFEKQEGVATDNPNGNASPGLGMAAYPGHPFLRKVLDFYEYAHFARWNGRSTGNIPLITSQFLDYDHKEVLEGGIVRVSDFLIYPAEYFCPINYYTGETVMTPNTRTIHHYMASWTNPGGRWHSICERIRFIMARMKILPLVLVILLAGCMRQKPVSEYDRTIASFNDGIGGEFSSLQWWRTDVKISVNVQTDYETRLWLTSEPNDGVIYDYKETQARGTVTMTAPQGYGNTVYLSVYCDRSLTIHDIPLSGKPEETISVLGDVKSARALPVKAGAPPSSLCGNSINGNPRYYEFNSEEMDDYRSIMELAKNISNVKDSDLTSDYELTANGPFNITWVDGYEASQKSHILGYFYHSPETYDDIVYQDICETHKWDYIDGLAKVQYQFDTDITIDGQLFRANEWYDANFDMEDGYGSTYSQNMDRIGDNAYNSQLVFNSYGNHISAIQGISFEINVPKGKQIGFYLRADEEPFPSQYRRLTGKGIKPYTNRENGFKGTCFSIEDWNVDGTARSFIYQSETMTWIGMEDNVINGDNDCNDVVFGLIGDLSVRRPAVPIGGVTSFPWTLAFEDVYRGADYDFNDVVIRLVPDYMNGSCSVYVLAAGIKDRCFLHFDGPDGDYNLGEVHQLLVGSMDEKYINTLETIASTPFVQVPAVPWPNLYSMANDAKRFYVEIKRGECSDCSDIVSLPDTQGEMPEAILVAGEWSWPKEEVHIFDSYGSFPEWALDGTRIRYWNWHRNPTPGTFVSF